MKTYTVIKKTVLILALITVSITTAAAIPCDCGDICVNETGWWRDGGAFNAGGAPIQDAVNNASSGDIICVAAGYYTENVEIATAHLTLAGEGVDVVTVTAVDSGDQVFEVTDDHVNISGFSVTGATENIGIYLNGVDHCNISDNTASGNSDGIYLDYSSNNTLLNNIASNNDYGIELYDSSNNTLTGNTANSNYCDGIYLEFSSNNIFRDNTVSNNEGDGIYIDSSSNNIFRDNTVSNNEGEGITLYDSSNNTLTGNTASNNGFDGISLYYSSNNTLTGNTANSNYYDGVYLEFSSNNIFLDNTVSNNDDDYYGIELYNSSDNLIYNNYFDNTNNVCDNGSNRWNTTVTTGPNIIGGLLIGGNYWSDYTGTDMNGGGLGDTSYGIAGGDNFDYHPLCSSASVKGDLNGDGELTPADAAIALRLAATGAHNDAADVSGDGQVTSLDALMIVQAAVGIVEL